MSNEVERLSEACLYLAHRLVVRTDLEPKEKIERIYEILSEFGAITYQED